MRSLTVKDWKTKMATAKKPARAATKLKDLKAKKNPKGGALNAYLKLTGQKQGGV
jgi:hypothetical protein